MENRIHFGAVHFQSISSYSRAPSHLCKWWKYTIQNPANRILYLSAASNNSDSHTFIFHWHNLSRVRCNWIVLLSVCIVYGECFSERECFDKVASSKLLPPYNRSHAPTHTHTHTVVIVYTVHRQRTNRHRQNSTLILISAENCSPAQITFIFVHNRHRQYYNQIVQMRSAMVFDSIQIHHF